MGRTRKSTMEKLTGHAAFPLVVAVWFAALIGLGSLVVPVALIERIVTATGLPQLVSAANPPLGTTARIAIALAGALAGAVLGLLIGRQAYRASHAQSHAVSPINAREELGEDGLDGPEHPAAPRSFIRDNPEDLARVEDEEREPEPEHGHEPEPEPEPEHAHEPEPEHESTAKTLAAQESEAIAAAEVATPPEPAIKQQSALIGQPAPANELDSLTLLQLAQRLQGAIKERREWRAARPVAPLASGMLAVAAQQEAAPADGEKAADEGAAREQDTASPSVYHPATRTFIDADELIADNEADSDGSAPVDSFTSLLAMTASVQEQTEREQDDRIVAVDEPADSAAPLVALDRVGEYHSEASKPARGVDPHEQALRDALMNLSHFR